jgi:hypothetical protein
MAAKPQVLCRLTLVLLAGWATLSCGAMLPLESYQEAPAVQYSTEETFAGTGEQVWMTVLRVLGASRVPIELANEDTGNLSTGWAEGYSLIWQRRRLGDRSEGGGARLPARYRLDLTMTETDAGMKVSVVADEETNFMILTGVDNETGQGYYRDDWRRTPSQTTREHEFLLALGRALGGGGSP